MSEPIDYEALIAELEDLVSFHRGTLDGWPTERANSDDVKVMARAAAALRHAATVEQAARDDESRWGTIHEALTTSELRSDLARLTAIDAIVNSRKPFTKSDVTRARQLWAALAADGKE